MRRWVSAWVLATTIASGVAACGPTQAGPKATEDDWIKTADQRGELDGDMDAAEMRWRRLIEEDRWADEALMRDDPPRKPKSYGTVAFEESIDDAPPPAPTFWGKMKSGADKVGKVTFAAFSVVLTVGMMVAPYLLL